tara:strand:- start:50 stop:514 length:465 start_codon:yes stop_codon:yes gene_type:complete
MKLLNILTEDKGIVAADATIKFLREKIYPKLNDSDMDKFVVEMCDHLDATPPSYRLNEENNYTKFEVKANELEKELVDTYNREDISVTIIQHSNGNKALGNVQIRVKEDLPSIEYQNMKNFISAQGFEITGGANYADDDGDRYIFPNIKFEFDL